MHCLSKIVKQFSTVAHSVHHGVKSIHALACAKLPYRPGLRKSPFQLHDFTRHYLSCGRTGNYPLQVSYVTDHFLQTGQVILIVNKMLHDGISVLKLTKIHDRHSKPCPQHARAHRRRAFVHHIDKCHPVFSGRGCKNLQVAESEAVHPDECSLVNT